ncbi:helix-turn-helix transcriptional regulator [Cryptosporangium phraense]|uniref:Helix-turn-helix domain-containing protein n=1 Tax=Cryptosporangium phraense TaxID=2593070 RepID=A0A545ARW1_9ACTN|nr:helix-turn-helix transcriptional regulator [Cryptosporangium phraense]TQS43425.1 helix-turn-helix domain-containing protein [Cryptosporangium phraense]
MDPRTEMKDFLQSRRARISPADSGLDGRRRRRVPGLRREEVAYLADVSVDYYARIERGDVVGVSEVVLRAVARALRLDETETTHLLALARAIQPATAPKAPVKPRETVRPGVQAILDSLVNAPAWVSNQRMDFLAGNALGRALYSDMLTDPDGRGNNARYVFLAEGSRTFFRDWDDDADDVVAILRHYAALRPDDGTLAQLIEELSARSEPFRERWAAHRVRLHRATRKRVHHHVVGDLDLAYERLHIPGDEGLSLFVHPVQPDPVTTERLASLAVRT